MFHGTDLCAVAFQGGASAHIGDQVAVCLDDGLSGEVGSLKLDAIARIGGLQGEFGQDARVKTGSLNGNGLLDRMLFVGVETTGHALVFGWPKITKTKGSVRFGG